MIYKIYQQKKLSFFDLIYLLNILFIKFCLSFTKPDFIIYYECFDDYLEKTKLKFKNKTISNIHDFL